MTRTHPEKQHARPCTSERTRGNNHPSTVSEHQLSALIFPRFFKIHMAFFSLRDLESESSLGTVAAVFLCVRLHNTQHPSY